MSDLNSCRNSEPLEPAIQRARLDKLSIFEVSESELETLERGSPDTLFLNLAIFSLSVAISFSIALGTTTINSDRVYIAFVCSTMIGYIAATTFSFLWYFSHKSVKSVVKQIRSRMPPEGVLTTTEVNDDA
ncbi:hypothetical protein [Gimesia maris]|uniref:hypothetical protein n=1 Tax=Gimesia maris TaxID=122 RepID=UPI003A958F96